MPPGSHLNPGPGSGPEPVPDAGPGAPRPGRRRTWAIGTPVVVLLCGGLFVASAENSEGTDLRPGRYTDLASLVSNESREYERLEQRVTELTEDVAALTERVRDRDVNRYRREIAELRDPAGMVPRQGEGVTVTLTDSPSDVVEAAGSDVDLNLFLVHQQDIQAVVNAMWAGGAEAVTVQGKRIVSTTGIKCIGNSVNLQGRPYSPPYVITGVGSADQMLESLETDDAVAEYRRQAALPEINVGWELETDDEVTAPAYDGLLDLSYAEPIR